METTRRQVENMEDNNKRDKRQEPQRRHHCDLHKAKKMSVGKQWQTIVWLLVSCGLQVIVATIIIDQPAVMSQQPAAASNQAARTHAHLQPMQTLQARNRTHFNFTHVTLDELTGSVYVGATDWLLQLGALDLKPEVALRTGPAELVSASSQPAGSSQQPPANQQQQHQRDCAPLDCPAATPQPVDWRELPLVHSSSLDSTQQGNRRLITPSGTMHTNQTLQWQHHLGQKSTQHLARSTHLHNYNKLLVVEPDGRQLLVCGSLAQGACRRHQLGQLGNFSDLIGLPVAANDEHSSSVALVVPSSQQQQPTNPKARPPAPREPPVLYVAATNSRQGAYREMVPALSARHLEPRERAMQIIERSFAESARVDISFELRDYYLVHYVTAFQWGEHVYFATVQRRSPLRQLEEWGHITRLARLCLGDLGFQSYTELTLECRGGGGGANYNLLQDAWLIPQAASQLSLAAGTKAVLAGAFAVSRDHTARSQPRSALCLFPMDQVERAFADNLRQCLGGSQKTRNMNYIAGSVNDCPRPGSLAANSAANYCSGEPLKVNGSQPLVAQPVAVFERELITALAATQANTAPLGAPAASASFNQQNQKRSPLGTSGQQQQQRHHQVLIAGTSEGQLKRLVVVGDGQTVAAHQFDQVSLAGSEPSEPEPVLADLHLLSSQQQQQHQFALAATPSRLVKLRVNACSAQSKLLNVGKTRMLNQSVLASDCQQCQQLSDPYCGWCASAQACLGRDECQSAQTGGGQQQPIWWPFDQIRCQEYQPLVPRFVALQSDNQRQPVEVNVRLATTQTAKREQELAAQLAQAHFSCHFDYLALANRSQRSPHITGATTKALQARLNPHTRTAAIGCPLPALSQRPQELSGQLEWPVRLSLRWLHTSELDATPAQELLAQALGAPGASSANQQEQQEWAVAERQLTLYDCFQRSTCHECLQTHQSQYACSWCPLANRCTFNSSHPDFGCAAAALASSTTPTSVASAATIRASHLTGSLDEAQASAMGASLTRLNQCPPIQTASINQQQPAKSPQILSATSEILVPHGARRSLLVPLAGPPSSLKPLSGASSGQQRQWECQLEVEGARARVAAKLVAPSAASEQLWQVQCQELAFSYQEEISTMRAQLLVLVSLAGGEPQQQQVALEPMEVTIYKCHLFGVSPPALTSTLGGFQQQQQSSLYHHQKHSSAAWRPHELFGLVEPVVAVGSKRQLAKSRRQTPSSGDCSLCLNVDRKYQCAWCANQCQPMEQCGSSLQLSTCPPPRIDSIHPNSGPLEGGSLLTIEGSNLGSNEREIQDKISVGGEPCQLVMYSVSTRIVCKTRPSQHGPQAATVFVGNKAGVTSAHDKFHYKAVHLTDVSPRLGPQSGGTRLQLTGSNLNIGSRHQIFLDDLPCSIDSPHEMTSQHISCITAPNQSPLGAQRITRLTLIIDNSTHHLPYPFTYQPDPIITNIEPAESFVSGGRLILITGHHLASPQSTKLLVQHEHHRHLANTTTCYTHNDTVITCLTPALSRDLLHQLENAPLDHPHQSVETGLSYEAGGLKLKMSLYMDDVRSVRNLDEYYHHLPHFLTYYEDPVLYQLPKQVLDYQEVLVLQGDNLRMKQLDQDMLITVGVHLCPIRSIQAQQVICEPPARVDPVYNPEQGSLVERPLLPVIALIGANLRFQLGYLQYHKSQYLSAPSSGATTTTKFPYYLNTDATTQRAAYNQLSQQEQQQEQQQQQQLDNNNTATSISVAILLLLSMVGFLIGFAATFTFAVARFRQSKAEREYKRIQLQMGSLDVNGQPTLSGLFSDNLHHHSSSAAALARSRALDYITGAASGFSGCSGLQGGKNKPFYQLNAPSFPPSPLTDISSLTGASNLISAHHHHHHQQQQQQQLLLGHHNHLVKLSTNGTIINSTTALQAGPPQPPPNNHNPSHQHLYSSANSSSSASNSSSSQQSSPNSAARDSTSNHLGGNGGGGHPCGPANQQAPPPPPPPYLPPSSQTQPSGGGGNLLAAAEQGGQQRLQRNYNWTQEAPSTIVPYAVIEACNLTLEGKNGPPKEFV